MENYAVEEPENLANVIRPILLGISRIKEKMTKNQKITAWVIFVATVVLLGYDVYAYVNGGVGSTISWVIYSQSKNYPIIPFALGLLMGHLFGQMEKA